MGGTVRRRDRSGFEGYHRRMATGTSRRERHWQRRDEYEQERAERELQAHQRAGLRDREHDGGATMMERVEQAYPEAKVMIRDDLGDTGVAVEWHGHRNGWFVHPGQWRAVEDMALAWLAKMAAVEVRH